MSRLKRPDGQLRWALLAAVAMLLTFAMAFVLVDRLSAPAGAPPTARPAAQGADEQVASGAEAGRPPTEPASADRASGDDQAVEPTLAARAEGGAATEDPSSASGQMVFRSRRALETVDPRELLRQGAIPPASAPK